MASCTGMAHASSHVRQDLFCCRNIICPYALDDGIPVFIFGNRIDTEIFQFRTEFLYEAFVYFDAGLNGVVDDLGKFVSGHIAVALEFAIGIAFHEARLSHRFNGFIGPVIFWYVEDMVVVSGAIASIPTRALTMAVSF